MRWTLPKAGRPGLIVAVADRIGQWRQAGLVA
jgi:hypothetical protein